MTRTGVLSLLIAAYAVTNTHQAYANSIGSNPHFLQGSRNMQAYMYEDPSVDLTQMTATRRQIFDQFIDPTAISLEGHITTDKIYYRAKDPVFIDLLVLDSLLKTPYKHTDVATQHNITVSILDANGAQVTGLDPINKLFINNGPAHGFQFKLPDSTIIAAGQYLIVASHPFMATATKTIVVQDAPSTASTTAVDYSYVQDIRFYGETIGDQQVYGAFFFLNMATGEFITDRVYEFYMTAKWGVGVNEVVTTPVVAHSYSGGIIYFTVGFGTTLTSGTVVTIRADAMLPDPADPTTLAPQYFEKTITIGAEIVQDELDLNTQIQPSTDYSRFNIHFFTESMSDLVPGTPQTVYFRAYLAATSQAAEAPIDFTGASLYAYDPNLPAVDKVLVQSGISSLKNGYGVLKEFRYDDSKIYFVEYTPASWIATHITKDLVYPLQQKIILSTGTLRIPIIIEGIQTRLSNIEKEIDKLNSASFPQYLLNDYFYKDEGVAISGMSMYGNTFDFGYANGYFFVKCNFPVAPSVKFPPLLVFNNFPSPDDFSNLLLDHTNRHMEGLVLESTLHASVVYPVDTSNLASSKFRFEADQVSAAFFEGIYTDMVTVFGQTQMDKFHFNKTANVVDYSDDFNYQKLSMVFRQVPFVPQEDSPYFGKYGPLEEQTANPDLYTTTDLIDDSKISYPTIVMTIKDKVLENDQDIIVQISTNENFDVNDVYILQVKQMESVRYQQILKLKARQYKEKYSVDASEFELTNGGIYQVNLYKVTDDYSDFLELVDAQTFCNLKTLTSSYSSMGTSDQTNIDSASSANIIENRIYDALNKLKIAVPGTTCLLISPDLVERFTESLGSISILKKPAMAYQVDITTLDTSNAAKTSFIQGQTARVTLKLKNVGTGAYLGDDTLNHYASLIVTEDVDLGTAAFYRSSITGKVYLQNQVDFEKYQALDPLAQVNQHFSTSTVSGSSDAILDILLTINNLRNSVFEVKLYSLLSLPSALQQPAVLARLDVFKKAIPQTFEQLSQMFGFNFQGSAYNANPVFTESDIRSYISQVADSNLIQKNIVNLEGADQLYHRAVYDPLFDVYSGVASGQMLTKFALNLPGTYKSLDNKYQAETQYFEVNIPFTKPTGTVVFITKDIPLGDIPANFKIVASAYGDNGFGYGSKVITVGAAFKVDFDLPERISAGDKFNITATIQNFNGIAMTVTPSISSSVSAGVSADWNYNDWAKNAQNKWIATPRTQWTFTSTQTSRQIPFQIVGTNKQNLYEIPFTFTAISANGTQFSITIVKSIMVIYNPLIEYTFYSGELATNGYDLTSSAHLDTEVIFDLALPSADVQNIYGFGELVLFPTTFSYVVAQFEQFAGNTLVDKDIDNLIHKMMITYQMILVLTYHPTWSQAANYPDLQALAERGKAYLRVQMKNIGLFLVTDPVTSEALGFTKNQFTTQTEGDVALTAYITTNVLQILQLSNVISPSDSTLIQSVLVQNVQWILSKFNTMQNPNWFFTGRGDMLNSKDINDFSEQAVIIQNLFDIQTPFASALGMSISTTLQNTLTSALSSVVTFANIQLLQQENDEFVYSAYQISLALQVLSYDSSSMNYNLRMSLTKQLLRYIQNEGEVITPVGRNTTDVSRPKWLIKENVLPVFGGIGLSRDVEFAAEVGLSYLKKTCYQYSIYASVQCSNPSGQTQQKAVAGAISDWLKTKSDYHGYFGSYRSTYLVNQLMMEIDDQTLYLTTQFKVDFNFLTTAAPLHQFSKTFEIDGDYMPIYYRFDQTDLSLELRDAETDVKFNVDVYGLTNPMLNTQSYPFKPIDSVIGWSFYYENLNKNMKNSMTSEHGLSFAVASLNQTYSATATSYLGSAATNGSVFAYEIRIENMEAFRVQKGIQIIIRPPACLSFDEFQLNDIQGPNGAIQQWQAYLAWHEYYVVINEIGKQDGTSNNKLSFIVYGTQVSVGTCHSRPFEASFVGSTEVRLVATPVI